MVPFVILVAPWWQDPWVGKLLAAFVGLLLIVLAVRLAQRYITRNLSDGDSRYYARKLITFGGYLAVILLVSIVFRDRLVGLTVAIGVAGAGIAFALQEVIGSVAGWIAISFGGFYRPGDRVQLGGIKGDVIDIGILRTTMMELGEWVDSDLYNGRVVRIANSFVFKAPVFNYSGDFPFLWDEIRVPVKHGSDHRQARMILEQVVSDLYTDELMQAYRRAWDKLIHRYLLEPASLEPAVSLVVTDNWLAFTVRYIVDCKRRRITKDILYTKILDAFAAAKDRVSIASTTVALVELPPLDVRLSDGRTGPGAGEGQRSNHDQPSLPSDGS
ncbi:mechanosensitive ion channel family protein [Synechococcus sp. Cruz-9H2]|nr:mechanosensitive ion channel family protein [Synechococcus sp. Cruz-9H2]MCP9844132.1 mechanosensitive ion channel family protein [Synechococcus sp. Edmonson 11F2]MCP9856232.1 mechanosensitive ion channel family protein [Synechococcus sp. Cruz-9C9]MCP9863517.1 mechanosensitive ion channel family protein [Synechococcus sp. Cruz-7E5]MCP9870713.1 mechanosensitive ion channel family protein [Synechococcus sp. Cruz-7B9]